MGRLPSLGLLTLLLLAGVRPAREERPNILWLTSEDNGPHLGAYGDPDATTPCLDALAVLDADTLAPIAPALLALPTTAEGMSRRFANYVPRLLDQLRAKL